ncbi:MAG: hypothetical protein GY772_00835 [bacterium]|nr:hypothetical protein [bacterium]
MALREAPGTVRVTDAGGRNLGEQWRRAVAALQAGNPGPSQQTVDALLEPDLFELHDQLERSIDFLQAWKAALP